MRRKGVNETSLLSLVGWSMLQSLDEQCEVWRVPHWPQHTLCFCLLATQKQRAIETWTHCLWLWFIFWENILLISHHGWTWISPGVRPARYIPVIMMFSWKQTAGQTAEKNVSNASSQRKSVWSAGIKRWWFSPLIFSSSWNTSSGSIQQNVSLRKAGPLKLYLAQILQGV